jgi:DnaJ-class molecular chaperone
MNSTRAHELLGYSPKDEPQLLDIKKRYRTLSLKHHPDKGGDPKVFQDINLAYRILIGEEKADDTILPPQSRTDKMFTEVFTGFEELFSKFSGKKHQKPKKKIIQISVQELFHGAVRELELVQDKPCSKCMGTGTGSKIVCDECSGAGYFRIDRTINQAPSFQKVTCKKCKGRGAIGRGSTKMCGGCEGNGIEYYKATKHIRIPKGVKHNTRIMIGSVNPIEIIVQHPNQTDPAWKGWSLNDDTRNLEYTLTISLRDAMLGNKITLQHPNETTLECTIPLGIQQNQVIKFRDGGLPPCPTLKMPPTHAHVNVQITIPKLKNKEDMERARTFFREITPHDAS